MDDIKLQGAIREFLDKLNCMLDSKETGNVILQINFLNGTISKNYKVATEIYKVSDNQ